MRNADIKVVMTAIRKEYGILNRDIATEIGITPNHLSKICNGRAMMTDIYRDLLLKKFPKCADQILTLPLEKVTPEPQGALGSSSSSPAVLDIYAQMQQLISITQDLVRDNQRNMDRMLSQQEVLIQSLMKMAESSDASAAQNRELVSQTSTLLLTAVELIDRLSDRVLSPRK
jgi:transcriptional regulator with XRE-family HTH domain